MVCPAILSLITFIVIPMPMAPANVKGRLLKAPTAAAPKAAMKTSRKMSKSIPSVGVSKMPEIEMKQDPMAQA